MFFSTRSIFVVVLWKHCFYLNKFLILLSKPDLKKIAFTPHTLIFIFHIPIPMNSLINDKIMISFVYILLGLLLVLVYKAVDWLRSNTLVFHDQWAALCWIAFRVTNLDAEIWGREVPQSTLGHRLPSNVFTLLWISLRHPYQHAGTTKIRTSPSRWSQTNSQSNIKVGFSVLQYLVTKRGG